VVDADPSFRPARRRDGYLALEDLALIGDGTASALVGLERPAPRRRAPDAIRERYGTLLAPWLSRCFVT
jgi:hypothetical protein